MSVSVSVCLGSAMNMYWSIHTKMDERYHGNYVLWKGQLCYNNVTYIVPHFINSWSTLYILLENNALKWSGSSDTRQSIRSSECNSFGGSSLNIRAPLLAKHNTRIHNKATPLRAKPTDYFADSSWVQNGAVSAKVVSDLTVCTPYIIILSPLWQGLLRTPYFCKVLLVYKLIIKDTTVDGSTRCGPFLA